MLELPSQPAPALQDGQYGHNHPSKPLRAPANATLSFTAARSYPSSLFVPSSSPSSSRPSPHHHHSPALFTRASIQSGSSPASNISSIRDTRSLEDMLRNSATLLENDTLCTRLPGGRDKVVARHREMQARLDHLYSLQTQQYDQREQLYKSLSERTAASETPLEYGESFNSNLKLELLLGTSPGSPRTMGNPQEDARMADLLRQSSLGSSPPHHGISRSFNVALTSPTHQTRGKIAMLPLGESLALQAQESQRLMAEAQAVGGKLGDLQAASRYTCGSDSVRLTNSKTPLYGDIKNEDTVDQLEFDDDEQEDYDWKQQGYYADGQA